MDTKSGSGSRGVVASEPAIVVAEGSPAGVPASAALDVNAASAPGASPGPAPSSSSERRAGAAGIAPSPALPRMTPEAALRSALGLCDYLLRHWAGPGEIGDMPSVASTRDDVLAGLVACVPGDCGAPPRTTLLAETHAKLTALAAGHGSRSLHLTIWDHEPWGDHPWSQRVEWSACVFEQRSNKIIAAHASSEDSEAVLAQIALALAPAGDVNLAVVALGELPEVAT